MDSRDPQLAGGATDADGPPDQLSYADATYLYGSGIPRRKAIVATATGARSEPAAAKSSCSISWRPR